MQIGELLLGYLLALPAFAGLDAHLTANTAKWKAFMISNDEVKEEDWQTAWKARLDKAQSMSSEEIFMAAQGAGNTQLREGEESEASKKRRAMAGCRNDAIRKKAGGTKDVIACNSRVMSGDFGFVLDAMQ